MSNLKGELLALPGATIRVKRDDGWLCLDGVRFVHQELLEISDRERWIYGRVNIETRTGSVPQYVLLPFAAHVYPAYEIKEGASVIRRPTGPVFDVVAVAAEAELLKMAAIVEKNSSLIAAIRRRRRAAHKAFHGIAVSSFRPL